MPALEQLIHLQSHPREFGTELSVSIWSLFIPFNKTSLATCFSNSNFHVKATLSWNGAKLSYSLLKVNLNCLQGPQKWIRTDSQRPCNGLFSKWSLANYSCEVLAALPSNTSLLLFIMSMKNVHLNLSILNDREKPMLCPFKKFSELFRVSPFHLGEPASTSPSIYISQHISGNVKSPWNYLVLFWGKQL